MVMVMVVVASSAMGITEARGNAEKNYQSFHLLVCCKTETNAVQFIGKIWMNEAR